jgi:tRNA(Ile)-lysidine synthase
MALLHLALQEGRYQLFVLHFNHQLRGVQSDGDERFVRDQAEALKLPFICGTSDVRAAAKGISIEMAARQLRHQFLALAAQQQDAEVVLAHHANDQIELFLMRLLRGVQGPGLAGMQEESSSPANPKVRLLRPLLHVCRRELEAYVQTHQIPYREDASNAELFSDRNRIRHTVVPGMRKECGEDFETVMLNHINEVRESLNLKREAARAWLEGANGFRALPHWLRKEIVATQLDDASIPIKTDRLEKLLDSTARMTIAPGRRISVDARGKLHIHAPRSAVEVELDVAAAGQADFAEAKLTWRYPNQAELGASADRLVFDADRVGSPIHLRHWRAGDRIRLSGRASIRPLHEMFSRNKIPREKRTQAIVATTAAGKIFWVEGLRITEDFKVTPATKRFLEWRWSRSQL